MHIDLNYPGIEIKVEFIVLREYLEQMETSIQIVCGNYIKKEEANYRESEYNEYSYIYQVAKYDLPRIIRMPYIVTIYTLFENSVTQLLKYAQNRENKQLELKDINAKDLPQKCNKYMKHVLNYNFHLDDNFLNEINILNRVRNCIAHTNGSIEALTAENAKFLEQIAKQKNGISITSNQLDVSHTFILEFLQIIEEAVKNLMRYIEYRYELK